MKLCGERVAMGTHMGWHFRNFSKTSEIHALSSMRPSARRKDASCYTAATMATMDFNEIAKRQVAAIKRCQEETPISAEEGRRMLADFSFTAT
jgi:hypothetical protein